MRRKNIKLMLLAVVTSVAMAGCGTDDGKDASVDDSGRLSEKIVAEKDSNEDKKENDKAQTTEEEIKESGENDSSGTESTTDDNTLDETDSVQESTSSEINTSNNTVANSSDNSNNGGTSSNNGNGGSSNGNTGNNTNNVGGGTGNNSNGTVNGNNPSSSNNNSSVGTNQGNDKTPVKVETETTAPVSVGNANSQISEQNKDIVNNNKTEYTDTSNNSSSKKIYVSENSVNYGYALAYVNGDTSRLDGTQKQIFAVVKPLIDNVMANYGTDPEREKAVHDYIVANCRYNIEDCTNLTSMEAYNFHPEGVFLKKKAVCQGYAESFKLCMDLLGIKCDIVTGYGNGQAHAWNVVCLDNEWYQIDCTWDDPLIDVNGQKQDSGNIYYNYFNITDSQMKKDHTYTYGTPCNGTKYGYDYFAAKEYGTIYTNVSDFSGYVNSQLAAGKNSITAYVRCEGSVTLNSYMDMEKNQINLGLYPTERGLSMTCQASGISDTIYVLVITITER